MNPKQIAGISGAVGLAVIGLVGVNMNQRSRAKRDLLVQQQEEAKDQAADYELELDGFDDSIEVVDPWTVGDENSTALWKEFNHQLGIERGRRCRTQTTTSQLEPTP